MAFGVGHDDDGASAGYEFSIARLLAAGLSSDARESVLAAHLAICKLEAGT